MSRRSVAEWRRAVFRSHRVSDSVRVYLLYLAEHMHADRKVSVPQATIEKALGKSKRRIDAQRAESIEAGFLSRISAGYKGRTAVYQGTFPTAQRVSSPSTLYVPPHDTHTGMGSRSDPVQRVSPHDTPLVRADLPVSPPDRNGSSYEEHRDTPAAYGLTVCDCHGFTDCSSLTNREESA